MQDTLIKIISNESEMLHLGGQIASLCHSPTVIFLYGNLGAGKTTFVRGFLRGLGYQEAIKSPTYTIVEPYQFDNFVIFHFDFYRLHNAKELEYIGIQDYFTPDAICLIEWPENAGELLPSPDLSCYIEFHHSERKIKLKAHSETGKKILSEYEK